MGRYVRRGARGQRQIACLTVFIAGTFSTGLCLAATLIVETASDEVNANTECSLREAIINANNNDQSGSTDCAAGEASPTDVIVFDSATNNTPIELSLSGTNENDAMTGDLDITESLIINGNGADSVTEIDGGAIDRVIHILNDADVEITDLAITNGLTDTAGAGVDIVSGSLELTDVGIFSNNIVAGPTGGFVSGGGIRTLGDTTLRRVSVFGNEIEATGDKTGQGAGVYVGLGGKLTVEDSLISENIVDVEDGQAQGGGAYIAPNNDPATAPIVTISLSKAIISGNQAVASGEGGASGGGINHQTGFLFLERVLVENNRARKTTDAGGGQATGGGISSFSPMSVTNSTISGNRSQSASTSIGGGLFILGDGGLNNTTITANQAVADPGQIAVGGGMRGNAAFEISNTILAANTSTTAGPDCTNSIDSTGFNLIGDSSGCTFTAEPTDLVGDVFGGGSAIDPMIGPLAANGGSILIAGTSFPLSSHEPLPDSAAIDAGDPNTPGASGSCEPTDQTGAARPIDGDGDGGARCDIGAVEYPGETASFGGGSGGGGALSFIALLFASLVAYGRRLIVK